MERTDVLQTVGAVLVGAMLVSAGVGLAQIGGGPVQPADASSQPTNQAGSDANRTITVASTGTATTEPDRAVVRLSVESTAADPTVARTDVAENASQLRTALSDLGLDASQIQTQGFNLYRDDRPRRPEGGEGEGPVYRASHDFVVEVEDIDRVGEVIDTSVDNGASSIGGVQFTISEDTREQLRHEALESAMEKSDARADTLASSSGLSVTGTQTVTTTSDVNPYRGAQLASAGDGGGGTDISSGPVGVTVNVQVTYEAENA